MFKPEVITEIKKHALQCYPYECCGIVTPAGYLPQENLSTTPGDHFKMGITTAQAEALGVLAYVHSHPDGKLSPSQYDMEQQIATAKPWGIVATDGNRVFGPEWWGKGVPRQPLIGRMFIHGIYDCYSLIRDYYAQKGIELPEVPREDGWWWSGQNLYADLFPEAGFVKISRDQIAEGDVFLAQVVGSKVVNHGGIVMGNNLIMHHIQGKLSTRETGGHWIWKPSITWLRHKSKI